MIKQILMSLMLFLSGSGMVQAANEDKVSPWKIEADLGQAYYSGAANRDGTTALGRLSFGRDLFFTPIGTLGLEIGVQSGNTMRLKTSKEAINALGGVPIEVQMKPMLDVLIDFQSKQFNQLPLNLWLKGGIAHRSLRVDRESINDILGYSPEFQVGVGYRINQRVQLNIGYQMILGKAPHLNVNFESEMGTLAHLPLKQAVLIGISYHLM